MWFYIGVIGFAIVAWFIYSLITGAVYLTFSVLGLFAFVIVLIAVRRGYVRGRTKEMYFAVGLILLYGFRTFFEGLVIGIYNFLYRLAVDQLNGRGVTHVNIDANMWKPNSNGQSIFDLIIFFGGAILLYAFTSNMKDPKVPRDILGAVVGGLASILFLIYGFRLLAPYIGPSVYNNHILDGTKIQLPQIKLPELRFQSDGNAQPLQGWDSWLPWRFWG